MVEVVVTTVLVLMAPSILAGLVMGYTLEWTNLGLVQKHFIDGCSIVAYYQGLRVQMYCIFFLVNLITMYFVVTLT